MAVTKCYHSSCKLAETCYRYKTEHNENTLQSYIYDPVKDCIYAGYSEYIED